MAASLATTHRLSPAVAGILLGAAVGLRLGLVLKRRAKATVTGHKPRRATAAEEAATAKRWARDVGTRARKGA